ncbi:lipid-A-disaccharide synthase [compost metagenome]
MDRAVVTELIQNDCNTSSISTILKSILKGAVREKMLQDYKELSDKMGTAGASQRTAKLITAYLKKADQ